MLNRHVYRLAYFCLLLYAVATSAQTLLIPVADGNEISVSRYTANGDSLFVFLPGENGFQSAEFSTATTLQQAGYEVWLADLFESRFLPVVPSSMDQIPAADVVALIDKAVGTGKVVFLVSNGRGILPLLRGAHTWQFQHTGNIHLKGVILISPKFYIETPDPGQAAELLPVINHTNLPVFIIQPRLSPWFWKLDKTVPALEQSGSDVYLRILKNVRDRFYYRPDATALEQAVGEKLPRYLLDAARLLAVLPPVARSVSKISTQPSPVAAGKKERKLKPYGGDPLPPALRLNMLDGKMVDLNDYRGKVVLVNFWASWCPPCVHEMPSMQRLQNRLGNEAFTILAVNMAESSDTIRKFLNTRVQVDFPILLDHDGAALKSWGVFAFPTSYVIDTRGRIRYALFGSVDWDTDEMLTLLKPLQAQSE